MFGGTASISATNSNGTSILFNNLISNNWVNAPVITTNTTYILTATNISNISAIASQTVTIISPPPPAGPGYYGTITFILEDPGYGQTYDVNMQYGNQTFISNNNSGNVSHEILQINRLQTANSIITITTSNYGRQTTGNLYYYKLNDEYFFYNNTRQSWGLGGKQYRIPESVGNNPLEFIIRLEEDVPDD